MTKVGSTDYNTYFYTCMDIYVLQRMCGSSTRLRARRDLWASGGKSREEEEGEKSKHPA